jgi:hypothetical protein
MNACEPWSDHVLQLVNRLGGWVKLKELLVDVSPREAWLRIDAPIFGSPYVESNSLSPSIIRELAQAGLGFELIVRNYLPDEPTHIPFDHPIS